MSHDGELVVSQDVSDDDRKLVRRSLFNHNMTKTSSLVRKPGVIIDLVLRTHDGQVVGGILCDTFLYCIYIDILWIEERYRGLGHGKLLVLEAERIAREHGCTFAHTATFSYQSPDFYRAMGYEVFGVIDDYPEGIKEYFLKKKL